MTSYDTRKFKQVLVQIQTKSLLDTIKQSGEAYNTLILRLIRTTNPDVEATTTTTTAIPAAVTAAADPIESCENEKENGNCEETKSLSDITKKIIRSYEEQPFEIADLRNQVERFITKNSKESKESKELTKAYWTNGEFYHDLRAVVHHLKRTGRLKKVERGKYQQASQIALDT